jgi:hydrogenase small subunit
MNTTEAGLEVRLARRGISRRKFLSFCGFVAAAMAMPAAHKTRIAEALAAAQRLPVVWLAFQDCTADTESFLRSGNPTVSSILLDLISLDYHETLMAAAGRQAEMSLYDTVSRAAGQYVAVVEGAIPTGADGYYCTIGGRSALNIAREVCGSALATIAVGSCAWDGGWPGAVPNPTQALGVKDAVPGISNLIALPGCPMNVVNFTSTLVHYMTYNAWPALDQYGRPRFAYGEEIHEECPRHDHYEEGRFALEWGDEGHRRGWCLLKLGCRGPRTRSNCPEVKWNDRTNWPIGAGHGCIGCTNPRFWDTMTPFYTPLPGGGDD